MPEDAGRPALCCCTCLESVGDAKRASSPSVQNKVLMEQRTAKCKSPPHLLPCVWDLCNKTPSMCQWTRQRFLPPALPWGSDSTEDATSPFSKYTCTSFPCPDSLGSAFLIEGLQCFSAVSVFGNTSTALITNSTGCHIGVTCLWTPGILEVRFRSRKGKKCGLGQKFVVHHWIWYLPSLREHWEEAQPTQEFYSMFLLMAGISGFTSALHIHSHFVTHYS